MCVFPISFYAICVDCMYLAKRYALFKFNRI